MAAGAHDARRAQDPVDARIVAALAGLLLVLALLAWAVPLLAAWAHSGRLPGLTVVDAVGAVGDERLRGADPARALEAAVAAAAAHVSGAFA